MSLGLGMEGGPMRHVPHKMNAGENDDLEEQRLPTIQNLELIIKGFELALRDEGLSAVEKSDLETYINTFQEFANHAKDAKRFSGKDFDSATAAINTARLDLATRYPSIAEQLGIDNVA